MPKNWPELHLAAYNADADGVSALLSRGEDPNCYDEEGFMPLHWLALRAKVADPLPTARLLLAAGANVNAPTASGKDTVLSWSIEAGHMPLFELLLSSGANPNLAADEVTPLMRAASERNVRMVVHLLKLGADPHAKAGRFTAVDYAANKRLARIIERFPGNRNVGAAA